jgi:hypothetical protein
VTSFHSLYYMGGGSFFNFLPFSTDSEQLNCDNVPLLMGKSLWLVFAHSKQSHLPIFCFNPYVTNVIYIYIYIYIYMTLVNLSVNDLTLILLTWRKS